MTDSVSHATFSYFRDFLHVRSGMHLPLEKAYLLDTRLGRIMRHAGCATLDQLAMKLRSGTDDDLARDTVEAMTTNETLFFRDRTPFDALREPIVPTLLARTSPRRRISIWSAACSTGQEPYSIAMTLDQMRAEPAFRELRTIDIRIDATDLSSQVIARAKAGRYSQFEVQRGLPITKLLEYFDKDGTDWVVSSRLQRMVAYRTLNLTRDFSGMGPFDIIYCRNVLMYFGLATRAEILKRMLRQLSPGGFLLMGAAETAHGLSDRLEADRARPGLYTLRDAPERMLAATG